MKSVDSLARTTFSGRRFTRKQLCEVQQTVETFKNLSRNELAHTLCEHLDWKTPKGKNKVDSCLTLLEQLESQKIIALPGKRQCKPPTYRTPQFETEPETKPVRGALASLSPIRLELVTSKEDRKQWQAYLQTYHYLGYKRPVGSYIGYFIISEAQAAKLGCLLFSASSAFALEARDEWIGWEKKQRQKLLHLILSNDRFLIFPWVDVPNLASQALSLATSQIADDWVERYGYRPVLLETFVDTTKYSGSCYRAANWQLIGKTKGRGCFDPKHERKETIKNILAYPLQPEWRHILMGCHRNDSLQKKYRNDIQSAHARPVDDAFVALWEKVAQIIGDVAAHYDQEWQHRERLIDSLLLVLLIFRLVCSKNSQSYGTTIDELWDSYQRLGIPLPQKGSIAPSSFCTARKKLDESIFKCINEKIISTYSSQAEDSSYRWRGHRIFAVDGSKVNLPRNLVSSGYKVPGDSAYYPQGVLSCLYELKSQIPFDFDLTQGNERISALKHLAVLNKDDIVVYDRGYFSYVLLHRHLESGIHAVFRLHESSFSAVHDFFSSDQTDTITTIYPSPKVVSEIRRANPELDVIPLTARLIKYRINNELFCLGTTLIDQAKYDLPPFIDIYHSRWGVEELYKVSKCVFSVEDLHAKSERGVKQELFAHFVLITMNRIFANQADGTLNPPKNSSPFLPSALQPSEPSSALRKVKTNFKNCIHVFAQNIEELLLLNSRTQAVLQRTLHFIAGRHQKERPGRSFPRRSLRPSPKWREARSKRGKKKEDKATKQFLAPLVTAPAV